MAQVGSSVTTMSTEEGGRIVVDMNTAVEELHKYSAVEMKKLLKDAQSLSFRLNSGKGTAANVDMEKLATMLPLHLLACVASSISQPQFRYLLRGVRLLHSLGSLASRYQRLEQAMLHEVRLREQIIDLVIFMLIVLADVEPDGRWGSFLAVLHSALVAGGLHLLTAFVTPEWRDVAPVLLAHPKVDIFIDAAFDAVRRDIVLLQGRFKALAAKLAKEKTPAASGTEAAVAQQGAEPVSAATLQQCEASLQVLQALSESQAFRDRVLHHKELCRNGGILLLVLAVLQLQLPDHLKHIYSLAASVSRLKSKVLAMLLKFCETESVSFLDEVAADARSLHVAKLVAGEIVLLVKGAFFEPFSSLPEDDTGKCPMGVLYLNALRLADVLSDDSNFRNLFMDSIAPDLATILAMDPLDFSSKWCGGILAQDMAEYETDAVLAYDPFSASGATLWFFNTSAGSSSEQSKSGCTLSPRRAEPGFYTQELSALLVKLFANLHCFNPEVCPADEKDRFLCLFMQCLTAGPLCPSNQSFFMTSDQTAVRVCENLHILVDHVASLSPELANDEDVQLASVFAAELHEAFCLSPDSRLEAPVIAYVRDGHENRLRGIIARRQRSERWLSLQRQAKSGEMEQGAPEGGAAQGNQPQQEIAAPEEASSAVDSKAEAEAEAEPPKPLEQPPADVKAEEEVSTKQDPGLKLERSDTVKEETETDNIGKKAEGDDYGKKSEADDSVKRASRSAKEEPKLAAAPTAAPAAAPAAQQTPRLRSYDSNARRDVVAPVQQTPVVLQHQQQAEQQSSRKRVRRIMSEEQITLMEEALKDEPEMQRYPELVQLWTNKLNEIGPEISANQLKNWINNRKAKLAKLAREGRAPPDYVSPAEKRTRHSSYEDHEHEPAATSSGRYYCTPVNKAAEAKLAEAEAKFLGTSNSKVGKMVILKDETKEVAVGVIQAITPGERGTGDVCLVKVLELKVERNTKIPIGSDSLGYTFHEAERKLGSMIVAWRFNHLQMMESTE